MNRLYNTGSSKFQKDTEGYWDIAKVISDNGWTATTDSSKSLLDGETEIVTKTYDFSAADTNGYTETTCTGFAIEKDKTHAKSSAAGDTIKFSVTGKCIITIKGYYSGWGTIKAGTQGEGVYDFNNGKTTELEKTYVNYSGACDVTLTASTTTYITKIIVEYDDSLVNVPVTEISVNSSMTKPTVGVAATMSATITPDTATNKSVKWTSSDTEVGEIDEFSGKVKFKKAGSVTFTATSRDGSGISGTSTTLNPIEATWTSAEWYASKDSSSTTTSGNGTGLGESAGTENGIFTIGTSSGVALGSVKNVTVIDGTTKGISTGIKMGSGGTVTFSVTKPATVIVKTGYCSGSNITNDNLGIKASDGGTATPDASNPTSAPSQDTDYKWTLTAGTYTVERAGSGYAPSIYYVRVDITQQ